MSETTRPPKCSKGEEVRFMYDKLRTEILHNETVSIQILGGVTFLIGAAIGITINGDHSDLFKIVALSGSLLLSGAGMKQSLGRVRSTFLIASYMRRYLEPLTEQLKWETRLKEFRLIDTSKSDNFPLSDILSTYSLIAFGIILLVIKYFIFSFKQLSQESFFSDSSALHFLKKVYIADGIVLISLLVAIWMIYLWRKEYREYIDCQESVFKKTWEKVDENIPS